MSLKARRTDFRPKKTLRGNSRGRFRTKAIRRRSKRKTKPGM